MKPQVRDRLVLPLAIPLGALAFIAAVTIGFSRILLGVHESVATAVAIMAAISVLFVGAVLVLRPRLGSGELLLMVGVAAVPFVLGGAVAAGIIDMGEEEEHEPEPEPFALSITAESIAFDQAEMTAPAGRPLRITFENKDPVQHNVAIFAGDGPDGEKVFNGDIFSGPETVTYEAPSLETGTYFFRCDVHPTQMTGTLVVEEAVESPEEPAEEAARVTAENIAFDTDSLTLSAEGTTIVFENKDTVPHNVAIFAGDGPDGEKVFTGDIFSGPATETYNVTALQPGNYYFRCDVHPNMNGTAQVQ